jgi:hypothetical protein
MKEETRASLELFVEKAQELKSCNFTKYLADGNAVNLRISISSQHGENVEYTGPNDEAMKAFLLTLRFFIQDGDGISFRYLVEKTCTDPDLSVSWRKAIKEVRSQLGQYLSGLVQPMIVYEPPPTRKEILDTFIYGNLAHSNKLYRQRFKKWRQNKLMFAEYNINFHGILYTMFSAITFLSDLCEQELNTEGKSVNSA